MKIAILNQKNKKSFVGLFSKDTFAKVGRENVLALGALTDDQEPIGAILILLETTRRCKLDWLFVDEKYRRQKTATALLDALNDPLKHNGYDGISFILQEQDILNGINDFLASRNAFFISEEIVIPTLKASVVFSAMRRYYNPAMVKPATHLSNGAYYNCLDKPGRKTPIHETLPWLWNDTSELRANTLIISQGTEITGILRQKTNEDATGVTIFDLYGAKDKDAFMLLAQLAANALREYKQTATITLMTCTGAEDRLVNYAGGTTDILRLHPGYVQL